MKKLVTLLLTLALMATSLCAFTACGDASGDDVLRVGMECAYQPFNWTQFNDDNGAVPIKNQPGLYAYGYDVMIAQKIAESLGKKLEVYSYDWKSLIPAVQSGALDLIIAGMSPTADRRLEIDFSDAYYESNLVIVVRKDGDYADATSLSDFAGATVAAQAATFHENALAQIANAETVTWESFDLLKTALNASTIDGYIAEEPGAKADCAMNADYTYVALKNNTVGGFAIADLANVTLAVGAVKQSPLIAEVNKVLEGITLSERVAMMDTAITIAGTLGL